MTASTGTASVNVAARLEQLAFPGGICASGKVAKEVEKKLAFGFDSAGRRRSRTSKSLSTSVTCASTRRRILHKRGSRRLWWALGRPAAIVAAVVAVWLALYYPLSMSSPGGSGTIPSVAVLPFKDLSADKSLGYLGEALANNVIAILSRFSDIAVV
ncbi:hypothetical protein [Sinorhizobium medicae]|uniref:hypothetical protein n=1 Tax=Sinorhizobium medicae TaxID=110321 RepID=UPI0027DB3A56|nr:hypothetical protein [Sinorhizobium medicae]